MEILIKVVEVCKNNSFFFQVNRPSNDKFNWRTKKETDVVREVQLTLRSYKGVQYVVVRTKYNICRLGHLNLNIYSSTLKCLYSSEWSFLYKL